MNLLEIRQWFVGTSGRYDLVVDTTTYADNGANQYISAAQRYLDRELGPHQKSSARFVKMLAVGEYVVAFGEFRAIKQVWMSIDQIGRWQLEKKTLQWLRESYPNMDTLENGSVEYYCPVSLRITPQFATQLPTFDALLAYMGDTLLSQHYAYNGIIFMQPTDSIGMIEIIGEVYSDPLVLDTDESFWSVSHPEVLVMATQMQIEMFSRNSEGVKDWKNSIGLILDGLIKDAVEEESAEINEMEG